MAKKKQRKTVDESVRNEGPPKPVVFRTLDDMPDQPVSIASTEWNKTGSWRYLKPRHITGLSPCWAGCPAGENVEQQLRLVSEGRMLDAWEMILEENPFPAVCGRVCYHPCERVCNRGRLDEPIAINAIERVIGNLGLESGRVPNRIFEDNGERVAVIGAGPAGLTAAYHLVRLGYRVTVYEAAPEPGGMLRCGIPKYRLPKEVLAAEIGLMTRMGVKIRTEMSIGNAIAFDDLRKDNLTVVLATGATASVDAGIGHAPAMTSGVAFLNALNYGQEPSVGKTVGVIGGGNTAIDAARSARRFGAEVTIFYRRSREEMPAFDEEVEDALAEGVRIELLTAPTTVEDNGSGVRMTLTKMKLGKPDDSGRRRPMEIDGSEHTVSLDTLISAIGERPELSYLNDKTVENHKKLATSSYGTVLGEVAFAAGDVTEVDQSVATAIGSGKRAAIFIDAQHRNLPLDNVRAAVRVGTDEAATGLSMAAYLECLKTDALAPFDRPSVSYDYINPAYFPPRERPRGRGDYRVGETEGFEEVRSAIDEVTAKTEADGCFHCGVCTDCDNCYVFCPDACMGTSETDYAVDLNYCKGCGICVEECPRGAIRMEQEREA